MNNEYKKSNFKTAFMFLNKKQRDALSIIYSFMRLVDDIADLNDKRMKLEILKNEIKNISTGKGPKTEFLKILRDVMNEYKIPSDVFLKLIEGVEKDLSEVDIETRIELEEYMYCVASTAGICVLKIVGYDKLDLFEIAKQTGFAVQMTNILRDLKEDLRMKRNYIPKEERIKFFKSGEIDFRSEKFKDFFDFEKRLTLNYYENAKTLFKKNKTYKLFVPAVMKNIYFELLQQLNFELNPKNHKISNWKRLKAVIKSMIEVIF